MNAGRQTQIEKSRSSKVLQHGSAFQAVVFDLDGTLLNTLEDIADSMNAVLEQFGRPVHPVERYQTFVGDGVVKLAERSLPPANRDEQTIQSGAQAFREIYARKWKVKTNLYPGVADLLNALAALNLKTGILSNKPQEFTKQAVDFFLQAWNFDAVLGQVDSRPPKPDPAGPRVLSQELGCSLSRVLYVGDSGVDMQTAVRSGMYPAGVLWGFRSAQELREKGAKTLIGHPLELLDLLK